MYQREKIDTALPMPNGINQRAFLSKKHKSLSGVRHSINPMIGIYLIEEDRFIYFNEELNKIIGNNSEKILNNGWEFLFSVIKPNNIVYIKKAISRFFTLPYVKNLLTLSYEVIDIHGREHLIKHEILIHKFYRHNLAINYFSDISKKEKINYFFKARSKMVNYLGKNTPDLNISPREIEVLHLIADGFSSKQIADMLFISNHTAISHRKNLIEKFQVRNTAHLIKKATELLPSF